MSAAVFVRDLLDGDSSQWVNVARATAIRVLPDDRVEGHWIVLAVFTRRSTVIGRATSRADAEALVEELVERTNGGAAS